MKFNKLMKLIVILLIISFITPNISFNLNPNKVVAAANLKINKKTLSLEVGKTYTLKITGTKDKIKWSTSNKSVATVSTTGKVKALKAGTAIITATINKAKLTCKITVKKAAKKTGITPTAKPTLTPTITPTVTPTPGPTPIPENLAIKNAPFESEEIEYDGYKMILPKTWTSEFRRDSRAVICAFHPDKEQYSKSYINLVFQETGIPAKPYSDMKKGYKIIYTPESIKRSYPADIKVTISDFIDYDFETKYGTAYKFTYKITFSTLSGQSPSTLHRSQYILMIDDYQVDMTIVSESDTLYPDMSKVGEYLLKTFELKKYK